MGAWGMGIFEDDTSCDILFDVTQTDAKSFIQDKVKYQQSDYLEYSECHEILVAGAIADMLLNDTVYAHGDEDFESWLMQQSSAELAQFVPALSELILKVDSGDSELAELWQESEENYPAWQTNVKAIADNLQRGPVS